MIKNRESRFFIRGASTCPMLMLMLGALLLAGCGPSGPAGPAEVIWDKNVCASCNMHLGDPAFAAQLRTEAGEALFFDDPGCLFIYIENNPALGVQAIWFRHLHEDRWVERGHVGFVKVEKTPMGFGIGAVDAHADGAMSFDNARQTVLASRHLGGSGVDTDGDGSGDSNKNCPCCAKPGQTETTTETTTATLETGHDPK